MDDDTTTGKVFRVWKVECECTRELEFFCSGNTRKSDAIEWFKEMGWAEDDGVWHCDDHRVSDEQPTEAAAPPPQVEVP